MNNLKKLTTVLLISIGSLLYTHSVNAQTIISLTSGNLNQTIEEIYNAYGSQIEISPGFLTNQLVGLTGTTVLNTTCQACSPYFENTAPGVLDFNWEEVANSAKFQIVGINLSSGESSIWTTINNFQKVDNLSDDLYLFAFQTQCIDGTLSTINLIIADKAILQQLQDGNCNCTNKEAITYSGPTNFFSVAIPWNSECPYTKYKITITGTLNGSTYESCHMVIHDESGNSGNGLDNVFVLPNCGVNATYGPGSFVGHDYYGISFTSWGMIVYLFNNSPSIEFSIDEIRLQNCNCRFTNRPGERPAKAPIAYQENQIKQTPTVRTIDASIHPNPVQNLTQFNYRLEQFTDIQIVLHEASGKAVKTLLNQRQQAPGTYQQSIDLSDYPPGIYHLVTRLDHQYEVFKLIKIQ